MTRHAAHEVIAVNVIAVRNTHFVSSDRYTNIMLAARSTGHFAFRGMT